MALKPYRIFHIKLAHNISKQMVQQVGELIKINPQFVPLNEIPQLVFRLCFQNLTFYRCFVYRPCQFTPSHFTTTDLTAVVHTDEEPV